MMTKSVGLWLLGAGVLLVACPRPLAAQDCPEGCEGCVCDAQITGAGSPSFAVTCEDYNQTALPRCLNESTSALYIYGHDIREIGGEDFANATQLTAIAITAGSLRHLRRGAFDNISLLRSLSLSDNEITDIDDGLFVGCPDLASLDLSGNSISQIRVATFADLPALKSLDLSQNAVAEVEDESFRENGQLEMLALGHNSLELIAPATFRPLPALLFLNLSHNNIDGVQPGALANATSLMRLDLSSNVINQDALPPEVLAGKPGLRELYMQRNSFEEVPVAALSRVAALETLDLGGCLIARIPRDAFSSLGNLKTLVLRGLPVLTSVEPGAFAGLTNLVELSLNDNPRLKTLDPLALPDSGLVSLTTLRLNNNSFSQLDEAALAGKMSLQAADVYGNPWRCSCHVGWMRRAMDGGGAQSPWAGTWSGGPTAPVCHSPVQFDGLPVYAVSDSDLTCQPALLLSRNELTGPHVIYEVLLGRGIPTTVWILPDGRRILPIHGNSSIAQADATAEEIIQANRTVLARLSLPSPTTADNGVYTLEATNAGGVLTATFALAVPAPVPGGLSGGQLAAIVISGLVVIALVVLGVVYGRSVMRRTPYRRISQHGAVEEATGHSAAHGASGDGGYAAYTSPPPSSSRQAPSLASGRHGSRSYGGTSSTGQPQN